MIKYVLVSLEVVGLLVLGEGLVPQRPGLASSVQQEHFVVRVPEDFPTIQAAVDAVAEGGTVLVGSGVYKENLKITKSLRLVGAGQEKVRIHPLNTSPLGFSIIDVAAEKLPIQVYLAGFTVEGPLVERWMVTLPPGAAGIGISIRGAVQALVSQVAIIKNALGFWLSGQAATLSEVLISENGSGILKIGSLLLVSDSVITANLVGIDAFNVNSLTIKRSLLSENEVLAVAITGEGGVTELLENRIADNGTGLYLALGPTIDKIEKRRVMNQPEPGPSEIYMYRNQIVRNDSYGIALASCLEQKLLIFLNNLYYVLYFGRQKILIALNGESNIIDSNGKGDLCPPDYPWPPGFRK